MEDYILETENLCKNFKKEKSVDNVSIKVKRNTIYGLLGPNGAGKSTILKMICGMLKPCGGSIKFDGHTWQRKDLHNIGSLIEGAPLYENLSAYENLKVRTILYNLSDERIKEVLEIVDLKNTGKKKSGKFSMGMKQRLGIAIALLNDPKLLILDEPTNGLDPVGIIELRKLLKDLQKKGITIIVSSHILSEIKLVADHIGIICSGKLCYENELTDDEDIESIFMEEVKSNRRE